MAHRCILACFVFIFCRVDGEFLYGLKGLSVSLEPDTPSNPADILWKHNGNKLVEFNGNEQHDYGTFKNRITLDWHTAEIQITDLRFEDSGNYELEVTINNMLYRSSKTLVVIDKVSKPIISCKMNNGSSSIKSGTLECSAESKDNQTQSLTKFEWESHGNVQPGPQLTISLGDEHDDHEYICNVSNPKSSETTTFTAKECYPDESSSVALAASLVTLSLIIFVGTGYFCYRKHKDNYNMTAQVEENQHFLPIPAENQSPGMTDVTTARGNANSQDVDEAYKQVPVKELTKRFEGEKGGKMNKAKAPPVPPYSALSPVSTKKEEPADELANLEKDKMSHQESSAAPEEPALETTLCQSGSDQMTAQAEENSTPTDEAATDQQPDRKKGGEMNNDKAPPVPPCSELPSEPAEEEDPQSDPSVSEKANEPDQADESADSEEDKMSKSFSTAPEGPELAPENAAGEQSEDMDKPVSTPEKEPVNEEIHEDLYGDTSQQPQSPVPTKPDDEHTITLQESPDKTPDQEKKVKTTQGSDESSEDEDETAQCGPKGEKPDQ